MKLLFTARASLWLRRPTAGMLLLAACSLTGCEELPPNQRLPSPSQDHWVSDVRGGYDWNYTTEFFVEPTTEFSYFDKLDRAHIAANWKRPTFEEASQPHRPEGMDDLTYRYYRRLTEPHWQEPPLLEIPVQGVLRAMHMDNAGESVLLVADQLEVWDVATQSRIHSTAPPIPAIRQAFWNPEEHSAVLVSGEQVAIISLPDGMATHRWNPILGEIVAADFSVTAGLLAVVTSSGEVVALSADLQPIGSWSFAPGDAAKITVEVNGKFLDYCGTSTAVRISLPEGTQTPLKLRSVLAILQPDADSILLAAAPGGSYVVSKQRLYFKEIAVFNSAGPDGVVTSRIHFVRSGWIGKGHWAVLLASQTLDGVPTAFIQDVDIRANEQSSRIWLPEGIPKFFAVNQTSETLALGYERSVKIIARRRWLDLTGDFTAFRAKQLVYSGRIDQAELYINALAQHPILRNEQTGEEFRFKCIEKVASWLEGDEPAKLPAESREKLAAWREADSLNPLLLRFCERDKKHWRNNWDRPDPQEGEVDAAELRGLAVDTPVRYQFQLRDLCHADKPPLDAEDILQASVQRFPEAIQIHSDLCNWLLLDENRSAGQVRAYIHALLEAYPVEARDVLYAEIALDLAIRWQRRIPDEIGFDAERLARGMTDFVEQRFVHPRSLAIIFDFSHHNDFDELFQKALAYHRQHYLILYDKDAFAAYHQAAYNATLQMLKPK